MLRESIKGQPADGDQLTVEGNDTRFLRPSRIAVSRIAVSRHSDAEDGESVNSSKRDGDCSIFRMRFWIWFPWKTDITVGLR